MKIRPNGGFFFFPASTAKFLRRRQSTEASARWLKRFKSDPRQFSKNQNQRQNQNKNSAIFLWISENLEGQNFFSFVRKTFQKVFFQFAEFFEDEEEKLQKKSIFKLPAIMSHFYKKSCLLKRGLCMPQLLNC